MQEVACIIALASQCVFFFFEVVQIFGEGPYQYLFNLGLWNATDLIRFMLMVIYFITRQASGFHNPFEPSKN